MEEKRTMGEGRKKAKESWVVPHPKLNPGCATDYVDTNPNKLVRTILMIQGQAQVKQNQKYSIYSILFLLPYGVRRAKTKDQKQSLEQLYVWCGTACLCMWSTYMYSCQQNNHCIKAIVNCRRRRRRRRCCCCYNLMINQSQSKNYVTYRYRAGSVECHFFHLKQHKFCIQCVIHQPMEKLSSF